MTAPTTIGTYYYGACVDAVSDESNTTNNCSGSIEVQVVPGNQPNLVVKTPSFDPARVQAGGTFTMSVTVWNLSEDAQGGISPATTLRYYLMETSSTDTEVATGAVPSLRTRSSSVQSVQLTTPSTPGSYRYRACVDAVADESDTTNNCSNYGRVHVE